jgi:hypothetical protein
VRKKHTNFVGEAQVNVQKGDLTKWWQRDLSCEQNNGA